MGNDSKKRAVGQRDYLPFGPIEDLGLTLDHKKVLAEETISAIHQGMRATKTDRVTYKGQVVQTFESPNHMARLRAAELAAQVTGLRTVTKEAKVIAQTNIVTPDWALLGSKDHKKPKVIGEDSDSH